jgi:phosphoribosyl-AMP cyclohydrolase
MKQNIIFLFKRGSFSKRDLAQVLKGKKMVELDFNKKDGLIPAIVQEYRTGEVLMLAYMNKAAWESTLFSGKATFYSRSRQKLWVKGETSGNVQLVKEVRIDCDNDTVLLKVDQIGDAACHTGYQSCFHKKIEEGSIVIDGIKRFDPKEVYK